MYQAYCSDCQRTVTIQLLANGADLKRALENDEDVSVMHSIPNAGDHVWSLSKQDKDNLRNQQRTVQVQYATARTMILSTGCYLTKIRMCNTVPNA